MTPPPPPVLLVDNHDSFTFNLVDMFAGAGAEVRVFRNTAGAGALMELAIRARALLLLSPGPGTPEEAGCCLELVDLARGHVPLAGVCLGHQAIAKGAGAAVVRAPAPVHGKATLIEHDGTGPMRGVPSPTRVGRYHSLAVGPLPDDVHVHAWADGVPMAISRPAALQIGLQFHPESILTEHGATMVANLLAEAGAAWDARG